MARFLVASLAVIAWMGSAGAAHAADPLADGFRDPPASARPRVWWHWLNGNITEDGITKDLEWMKRAGIGGVQTFDASLGTPQVVKDRLAYMTPAWKQAFAHAADTADRLNLELAIAASPGWSETGGPWVAPADAMKKLVWSETDVAGGKRFAGRLAAPSSVTGPYGASPLSNPLAAFEGRDAKPAPTASGEIAVFAYPVGMTVAGDAKATDQAGAPLDIAALEDGREDTQVSLPRGDEKMPAALTIAYPKSRLVRSATLFIPDAVPPFGDPEYLPRLEALTAAGWRAIATLPLGNVPTTVAFDPVEAQRFRLVLAANDSAKRTALAPPAPGAIADGIFPAGPVRTTVPIASFVLSAETRTDRFEAKAGFATVPDYYALAGNAPDRGAVAPDRVIDLTDRLHADGTLDWTPPPGRWRIVRLGWSLLGTTNHPASPEATGLEVDKYDGAAVRRYLSTYLDTYKGAMGPSGRGIDALLTDSIESGDANWTPQMIARFRALRGYDARPWLPVLTGAVIGSRAQSDAFLYDYRRTLADLLTSEHYGTIATIAHEHGLKLYGEALEDGRPQLGDDLAMRAHTDVPMAAMWAFPKGGAPRPTLIGDILGAASVAHVYGQNLVAAESFTASFAPWAFAPSDLRRVADLEFALGVNRPVIHTSVLSPMDDKEPGLSLAIFGQYFNRHETWAEMARPWVDYLARSSFLLQQGRHAADVAYFAGEEAPLTALYAQAPLADVPTDRGFDFVNADMLVDQLSVSGGVIVARGGARYRALYLGGSSRLMTLPTLRRIAELADAGAMIIGDPPIGSPSLADDPAEFATLVHTLWRDENETRTGRGQVTPGHDIGAALGRAGIVPDFTYAGANGSDVLFQHRILSDADIYFLSNRTDRSLAIDGRFRASGRAPEIWRADAGTGEPASYRRELAQTIVPLALAPEESLFVIFRRPAPAASLTVTAKAPRTIETMSAPWLVAFQPGRGAPPTITLPRLAPLELQADPGVKFFSGVARYTSDLTVPRETKGALLDLGQVGDVAELRVNGKLVGIVWHAPFRLDLSRFIHAGKNSVDVRVANLWVNRLIGDAQPDATKRTFIAAPGYRPDAPLRPSGLIGPVTLLAIDERKER
ncbi:glycosyl hydrolase [Sphingomonas sp. BIUV-7]|uniref:Glycosyl hydrolase n=1 Tax=Sphingomonas natans TaxID=3063330 RepID=A0ABT8Y746_9SPHN|nr:glycosyl hydrolase [Sphingomonas sp. BIUV-7]MDO6414145.1 glycosyl hydrolase [Sphingomonas sp. BIUV-7]